MNIHFWNNNTKKTELLNFRDFRFKGEIYDIFEMLKYFEDKEGHRIDRDNFLIATLTCYEELDALVKASGLKTGDPHGDIPVDWMREQIKNYSCKDERLGVVFERFGEWICPGPPTGMRNESYYSFVLRSKPTP